MVLFRNILFLAFLFFSVLLKTQGHNVDFANRSTDELEARLDEVSRRIQELSHYTMSGGIGPIGYRTDYFNTPYHREVIKVDWGHPEQIDEVVIVPTLRRVEVNHYEAYEFPLVFNVFCGNGNSDQKTLIASFTEEDELLPRTAPVVVPFDPVEASWVSVEASVLSHEVYSSERFILKLSEILAFSGNRNVALQADVTTTSKRITSLAWGPHCLVDGFLPYLMDSAKGEPTPSVISQLGEGDPATLEIDLQDVYVVDGINLHTAEIEETIPSTFDRRFGVPRLLVVRGALRKDFKDFIPLLHFQQHSPFEVGPIISRHIPPTACRYIKLVALEPYVPDREDEGRTRFGFSEVEVFSGSENVALHKPVRANFDLGFYAKSTAPLTDGHNINGCILPIRTWLEELALRHDLERERPVINAELKRRYAKQKREVKLLIWLSALLGTGVVMGILVARILRQHAIIKTRKRIAADIHDELGANLHAIGLLGNLAHMLSDSPEKQSEILSRLQEMTKRTGLAARYCINILESKELYKDIVEDMRRTMDRLAADLDSEITFQGKALLRRLKSDKRIDFFLFYKECLANVIRHSGATRVACHVCMTMKELTLTVTDNGHGEGKKGVRTVPNSLYRRARLLGASVDVTSPPSGGTCIKLILPVKHKYIERG